MSGFNESVQNIVALAVAVAWATIINNLWCFAPVLGPLPVPVYLFIQSRFLCVINTEVNDKEVIEYEKVIRLNDEYYIIEHGFQGV